MRPFFRGMVSGFARAAVVLTPTVAFVSTLMVVSMVYFGRSTVEQVWPWAFLSGASVMGCVAMLATVLGRLR